jgi:hypothetical protein
MPQQPQSRRSGDQRSEGRAKAKAPARCPSSVRVKPAPRNEIKAEDNGKGAGLKAAATTAPPRATCARSIYRLDLNDARALESLVLIV